MVSMATPVIGLRSLAFLVLGFGFLASVMAFDLTRKDNVRVCPFLTDLRLTASSLFPQLAV